MNFNNLLEKIKDTRYHNLLAITIKDIQTNIDLIKQGKTTPKISTQTNILDFEQLKEFFETTELCQMTKSLEFLSNKLTKTTQKLLFNGRETEIKLRKTLVKHPKEIVIL